MCYYFKLIAQPFNPRKGRPPVLRNLIISILTDEIKKEFTNIFSENRDILLNNQVNTVNNDITDLPPTTIPRGIRMVDTAGPLFFSQKEQRLLDYLQEFGPAKQAQIVKYFKDHANPINDTTVKELLANLGHRRAISTGPDGYEIKR